MSDNRIPYEKPTLGKMTPAPRATRWEWALTRIAGPEAVTKWLGAAAAADLPGGEDDE